MSIRDNSVGWTRPRPPHDTHFSTRPPQDTQVFTPARQTNNKYNRTYAQVAATPYQRQFVKYNQQTTKQFRQEQDDSFNCKQQTQQLNTRQTSKPQNTDTEFGENVRIMYKAITMLHHLNNTTIEPPTITRLVDYLSNIIKPAVPNPLTGQLLNGNARNWAHTTMLILQQHYSDTLNSELDKLITTKPSNWHKQFEVSVKWARRNRGKKLKQETIERARKMISTYFGDLQDETSVTPINYAHSSRPVTNSSSCHDNTAPCHTEMALPQITTTMTKPAVTIQTKKDNSPTTSSRASTTPQIHSLTDLSQITLDKDGFLDTSFGAVVHDVAQDVQSPLPPRPPRTHKALHPTPDVSSISINENPEKNCSQEKYPHHSTAVKLRPVAAPPSPVVRTRAALQLSLASQHQKQISLPITMGINKNGTTPRRKIQLETTTQKTKTMRQQGLKHRWK